MHLQNVLPADIEKRSMEIIGEELGQIRIDPEKIDIVKRVIHTSADFDYARNMLFSDGVVEKLRVVFDLDRDAPAVFEVIDPQEPELLDDGGVVGPPEIVVDPVQMELLFDQKLAAEMAEWDKE